MAGGLIHNFGTMTKPLHAGMTCRDGVMAAQLAQQGLTAGDRIIEAPHGFIATVLRGTAMPQTAWRRPGQPLPVQDALIIKSTPVAGATRHTGQPVQPDAGAQLQLPGRSQRRFRPALHFSGDAGSRHAAEGQIQRHVQRGRGPGGRRGGGRETFRDEENRPRSN